MYHLFKILYGVLLIDKFLFQFANRLLAKGIVKADRPEISVTRKKIFDLLRLSRVFILDLC